MSKADILKQIIAPGFVTDYVIMGDKGIEPMLEGLLSNFFSSRTQADVIAAAVAAMRHVAGSSVKVSDVVHPWGERMRYTSLDGPRVYSVEFSLSIPREELPKRPLRPGERIEDLSVTVFWTVGEVLDNYRKGKNEGHPEVPFGRTLDWTFGYAADGSPDYGLIDYIWR